MMRVTVNGLTALRQIVLICTTVFTANCQASPTNIVNVDTDFKYQGEYIGKVETVSPILGVQIVAKGNGQFSACFLLGGLPGLGWDTLSRIDQNGTLQLDGVHFLSSDPSKEYSASISLDGESISGKTPKGELFTLNKVIRRSPTLDSVPTPGSNVHILFNGKNLSAFEPGSAIIDSGFLLPTGSAATGATTIRRFGDFTLHLEFREPYMPNSTEQGRGNSGVYLQGRYELQILDSFGLNLLRNGAGPATQECGAFYQLVKPSLNMSFPPLSWQTYDIDFTKAVFDSQGKNILEPAVVTVRLNGVIIHDRQKLLSRTLLGDSVTSVNGPLRFQAHGDPVSYRNIWVVEKSTAAIRPILLKRSGRKQEFSLSSLSLLNGRRLGSNPSFGYYFLPNTERQYSILRSK